MILRSCFTLWISSTIESRQRIHLVFSLLFKRQIRSYARVRRRRPRLEGIAQARHMSYLAVQTLLPPAVVHGTSKGFASLSPVHYGNSRCGTRVRRLRPL